ncbi:MAG: hypothetical protein QNJ55_34600 [Xenococcus sp. MO_188.B8]|nr:hypothetical protein [Xenococcus sp. MO_188.B8]
MPISDRKFNFQITDLPQGQLAEANIAGFDSSEKPNAGTILIDQPMESVGLLMKHH